MLLQHGYETKKKCELFSLIRRRFAGTIFLTVAVFFTVTITMTFAAVRAVKTIERSARIPLAFGFQRKPSGLVTGINAGRHNVG